jgi:integrase
MSVPPLLNAADRRRSRVTLPGHLARRAPRNKGLRYPPDPPTVEEIVALMRQAGDGAHWARMRAFIVLLWRAGLRINEALTVTEHDLAPRTRTCPTPSDMVPPSIRSLPPRVSADRPQPEGARASASPAPRVARGGSRSPLCRSSRCGRQRRWRRAVRGRSRP